MRMQRHTEIDELVPIPMGSRATSHKKFKILRSIRQSALPKLPQVKEEMTNNLDETEAKPRSAPNMRKMLQHLAMNRRRTSSLQASMVRRMEEARLKLEAASRAQEELQDVEMTDAIMMDDSTSPPLSVLRETPSARSAVAQLEFSKPSKPLKAYQHAATRFIEERAYQRGRGCLLGEAAGSGKTAEVLHVLLRSWQRRIAMNQSRNGNASLVIAPKNVLNQWRMQIKEWFGDAHPFHIMFLTNKSDWEERMSEEQLHCVDLVLTTHSMLSAAYRNSEIAPQRASIFFKHRWDWVVADEAHEICNNPSSDIFKAACSIQSNYNLFVSATPLQNNHVDDLSAIITFLRLDEDRRHFDLSTGKGRKKWFAENMFRSGSKSGTSPFKRRMIAFETREERTFYEGAKTTGDTRANTISRLRLACNSPALVSSSWPTKSTKMNAVLKYVQTELAPGEKCLIFSCFVKTLEEFIKWLPPTIKYLHIVKRMEEPERERTRELFRNSPDIQLLLCTTKLGALGNDLEVANHVILFELWWNPTLEEQVYGRINRPAQTRTKHAVCFVMKDTIEEYVLKSVDDKRVHNNDDLEEALDNYLRA